RARRAGPGGSAARGARRRSVVRVWRRRRRSRRAAWRLRPRARARRGGGARGRRAGESRPAPRGRRGVTLGGGASPPAAAHAPAVAFFLTLRIMVPEASTATTTNPPERGRLTRSPGWSSLVPVNVLRLILLPLR